MRFITKKFIPRRAFIKGVGASLSLPLLDAMIPAATASSKTSAVAVRRLGYVFMPMGCDQSRWTPRTENTLNELSPILDSLAPVKDKISVMTNMELRPAYPGSHATSNSSFLSAAKAKVTESSDYYLGTTADQLAAQQIGQVTQLPSIELAMDLLQTTGQCDNGYACVYQNNLSWSSPTTPLPAEAHPRLVFENLFGEGGTLEERKAALGKRASLLDAVAENMKALRRDLGASDRNRLNEYLDSIREVERRIQQAENASEDSPLPDLDRPMGVPATYADHCRLMFDLQLLAYQGDITRIATFQMARETSSRSYPEIGVPDPHHPLSHHGDDPGKIERMSKINAFHVSLFSEYLKKLKDTPEGNGSLLDNVLILYGSGIGNPNVHDHTNLPVIVAGGAAGGMKGNRHIRFKEVTPLANLHLSLLDKAGVNVDYFGDSTGKIDGLFEPLPV
ncbi:MAG: hypothetical protein CMI18_02070 [Opitutaceae bacterium]|nr:hypothetical protein [Opitutaceae bacterium]|tara:strand:+ start:2731 stop:4077 length:1347 start_codon:yes stop_codon:yes gene_type:complete